MYRKYRIVEGIASSVPQYESYRDQVYRYTPSCEGPLDNKSSLVKVMFDTTASYGIFFFPDNWRKIIGLLQSDAVIKLPSISMA